jgi:NitT/TauT family transport system ATP-binding protein
MTRALLEVQDVSIDYASEASIARIVTKARFSMQAGERFVLLGASGCGKSTLLKAVAGYLPITEGQIFVDGQAVRAPGPDRIMVFQEFDQLLPWKTVAENIAFGLRRTRSLTEHEIQERVHHVLEQVKLSSCRHQYPYTLSGGMKQRVAIARAMAMEPRILLMDEPFAALDALTRSQMQSELLQLWEQTRFSLLFVTHSIREALLVGSRILIMTPDGQMKAEIASAPDREAMVQSLLFGANERSQTLEH